MTISQSRISNNTAGFRGGQFVCEAGAIYNVAGDLVIEDSTISSNHIGSYYVSTYVYPGPGLPPMLVFFEIDGDGGGLLTNNGKVAIHRCTIAFNHGSGIHQRQAPESFGRVDVRNSTIVSNIVFGADGASSTLLGGLGGGIYSAGVMQVEHSTIVGNSAVNSGSAPTRGGASTRSNLSA